MTRTEAVAELKSVLSTPTVFGAGPDIKGLDLGGLLDFLNGIDFDNVSLLLTVLATFIPGIAPFIPIVERALPILKQILQLFGIDDAKEIIAEATA